MINACVESLLSCSMFDSGRATGVEPSASFRSSVKSNLKNLYTYLN